MRNFIHRLLPIFCGQRGRLRAGTENFLRKNSFAALTVLPRNADRRAIDALVEAVQHDRYHPRYYGNLGLKALCGMNLTDFGYNDGEGAFVSIVEVRILNPDPLFEADRRAIRFTALRDFLKWLQTTEPKLYDALSSEF